MAAVGGVGKVGGVSGGSGSGDVEGRITNPNMADIKQND